MDCNPNDPAPLPVVNRTSSTYRCPKDHGPEAYGVVSGEPPRPFVGQLAHPF